MTNTNMKNKIIEKLKFQREILDQESEKKKRYKKIKKHLMIKIDYKILQKEFRVKSNKYT